MYIHKIGHSTLSSSRYPGNKDNACYSQKFNHKCKWYMCLYVHPFKKEDFVGFLMLNSCKIGNEYYNWRVYTVKRNNQGDGIRWQDQNLSKYTKYAN